MCGRFVATAGPSELAQHFEVDEVVIPEEPEPRYNVAPTLEVPVVAESRSSGTRRLGLLRWGLVPSWAKDPSIGNKLINARAESAGEKPAFRKALSRRRCLVPADGFYEWKRPVGGKGPKQPYLIQHADGSPLALAGLWELWRPPGSSQDEPFLRTFTILTTSANEVISELHDRMPVVIPQSGWDRWLDPEVEDAEEVRDLMVPAPSEDFHLIPVSTKVNNVRNEGPELIECQAVG